MAPTAEIADLDGRRLRRTNNREAVLDAMEQLYAEGRLAPSSAEIAERAGLSARSLFRYFDDVEDLNRAAIERLLAKAAPLLDLGIDPSAPLAERIDAIVRGRVLLYEAIAPGARATRAQAHRSDVVARQLHEARVWWRKQEAALFAPELRGDHAVLGPAVEALLSFETFELLRRDRGLSKPKAVAALTTALTQLLTPQTKGSDR